MLFLPGLILSQEIYLRINQAGYFPAETKMAFLMSDQKVGGRVDVVDVSSGKIAVRIKPANTSGEKWGKFSHQYTLDLSEVASPGRYVLRKGEMSYGGFLVQDDPYYGAIGMMTRFMQQQRCGYNPYFDVVCHQHDGRLFDAPVPDSTYMDFSGGWHDAGDQLKYLITSSNAVARMLLAFEVAPGLFMDSTDALGHPDPNGVPDILDEARWGLEWILKLHPKPGWLIHQVADDRDHRGFKFPDRDNAEYGWGSNSYRPAYFAKGEPQGLGEWRSEATGIANLAGRSAAALSGGARIWMEYGYDIPFAVECREAAISLYRMGLRQQGFQQGNSYGAPYRYNEDTWTDDLEWAAAELYFLTGERHYLDDAIRFAGMSRDQGWMAMDTMRHYQKYPFMNIGHYMLYQVAPDAMKEEIASWYRANIERVLERAEEYAFRVGVPFLWCSNNLFVNFITQVLLYEEMTGDLQFHDRMLLHRDWLFGRNPWGTSMFTGFPEWGEVPEDVHLPATFLLGKTPAGGLIDGPVYKSIHDALKGLTLTDEDEFAIFQNDFVVYHDDIGDYATNEPTMDGTADAILMMALMVNSMK